MLRFKLFTLNSIYRKPAHSSASQTRLSNHRLPVGLHVYVVVTIATRTQGRSLKPGKTVFQIFIWGCMSLDIRVRNV